jgi:hypothetical protein
MNTIAHRIRAVALLAVLAIPAGAPAQIAGQPGAFSRLGFGARGMGMGNAMAAVRQGDVVSYYNPALLPWMETRHASASVGLLSLDRRLNFLGASFPLPPAAGVSVGLINSGVSGIDGRDSDGEPTGELSTSENAAYLGFGIRFKPGFSLGVNLKLLYYNLYEDISSTTFGFDIGGAYPLSEAVTVAVTVRDVNSKYSWDTSDLYGQNGQTSNDRFPLLYTGAVAVALPDSLGLVAVEIEASGRNSLIARAGTEVNVVPELSVRAGIDRIDLKEEGNGIRPTFGLTARKALDGWTPAITYAFVVEPFSPGGMHVLSLAILF